MIRASKREWAENIINYGKAEMDKGLSWIKTQKINHVDGWQYFDVGRCIGAIKQANTTKAIHKPFKRDNALDDLTARDEAQKAGKANLCGLKAMFAPTSTRDTTIEQDLSDRSWAGNQGAIE